MNLVVARDAFALVIVEQRSVANFVGNAGFERNRAADNPHFVALCGATQKVLDRAFAGFFAGGDLVRIFQSHQCPMFRQGGKARAVNGRHFD